ncbi:MAG: DDE-type integrase/transposase/recombinase, partial [Actinomycetota bacterium]
RHLFVLTLGFSRRSFYISCLGETLSELLDAHERAFEHFGGHTREHLYDRPRTVCQGTEQGRIIWNPTFRAFAEYWGFEPRLCRPYRAQTKGKVERAIREVKEDFLRWLTGQVLPARPTLGVHDSLARQWTLEVVSTRRHRTTGRVVGEAWAVERPLLREIPARIISSLQGERAEVPARVIDLSALRASGDVVADHALADYEGVMP